MIVVVVAFDEERLDPVDPVREVGRGRPVECCARRQPVRHVAARIEVAVPEQPAVADLDILLAARYLEHPRVLLRPPEGAAEAQVALFDVGIGVGPPGEARGIALAECGGGQHGRNFAEQTGRFAEAVAETQRGLAIALGPGGVASVLAVPQIDAPQTEIGVVDIEAADADLQPEV